MKLFLESVLKKCLPGILAQGKALVNAKGVICLQSSSEELLFQVKISTAIFSACEVSLWPLDDDWYCTCKKKDKICAHAAACLIYLQEGKHLTSSIQLTSKIQYSFFEENEFLVLKRFIFSQGKELIEIKGSLNTYLTQLKLKKIQAPEIIPTQADQRIDHFLTYSHSILFAADWKKILKDLCSLPEVFFSGEKICIHPQPLNFFIQLTEKNENFFLKFDLKEKVTKKFKNDCAFKNHVFYLIEPLPLKKKLERVFQDKIHGFTEYEVKKFFSLSIQKNKVPIEIQINSKKFSQIQWIEPELTFHLEAIKDHLFITPQLKYAECEGYNPQKRAYFILNSDKQKILQDQLKSALQLNLGQKIEVEPQEAFDWIEKLKSWKLEGSGVKKFQLEGMLEPKLTFDEEKKLSISFQTGDKKAEFETVHEAWKTGKSFVSLGENGWAKIPKDWMEKFGIQLRKFLAYKHHIVPIHFIPELIPLIEEAGGKCAPNLQELKNQLMEKKPSHFHLPSDLTVKLRHYQTQGFCWLSLLREKKLGALLADEMGLGKTLQAICNIQGKTLIVAPTSVLHTWVEQVQTFRPLLKLHLYYGPNRKMHTYSDIILTSYTILRIEIEKFKKFDWHQVILDEAQIARNPHSQIAQTIFQLRAQFRLALSGTPIENQLEDLWSLFQFLNPGLLGSFSEFQKKGKINFRTVQPFILRRTKKEVAKELPPKIESILYCELDLEERKVYESLLASTKKELIKKIDEDANPIQILELLLRLRQACCHSKLIPGQTAHTSSKLQLLLEHLEIILNSGHKVLVFSQWTSLLDLVEPELKKMDISFARIDGTTLNRDTKIQAFQTQKNPSLMLISIKAGGTGITLTAATHVFILDPWWNPMVEEQAIARAHRIGQHQSVFIYRLIAKDTIEDHVMRLQKEKRELSENLFKEEMSHLSPQSILNLLNEVDSTCTIK